MATITGTITQDGSAVGAGWQIYSINKAASALVVQANNQLEKETTYTAKTYTPAS